MSQQYSLQTRNAVLSVWCIQTFCLIVILLIDFRVFCRLLTRKKQKQKIKSRLIFILPILSYAFYIVSGLCAVLSLFGVPTCIIFTYGGPASYTMAKLLMYTTYIYRIYLVYCDVLTYSKKICIILFVSVVIYSVAQMVVFAFTNDHNVYYFSNGDRYCTSLQSKVNLIGVIMLDLFISTFCTYLFIRPLLLLARMDDHRTQELYDTVAKFAFLTFASVATTFLIFGAVAVTGLTSLICIDIVINCVCLMLFNGAYDKFFHRVCCGPMYICHSLRRMRAGKSTTEKKLAEMSSIKRVQSTTGSKTDSTQSTTAVPSADASSNSKSIHVTIN